MVGGRRMAFRVGRIRLPSLPGREHEPWPKFTPDCVANGLTVTDFAAHARQDPDAVQAVTAHTALGRLGEAEDIAGVATWLASDEARWVTGQYIEASGGIGLA
jgi:NAD(P)-dependent dehydrogenase (short-subunit alcohol dehydrogenase family)